MASPYSLVMRGCRTAKLEKELRRLSGKGRSLRLGSVVVKLFARYLMQRERDGKPVKWVHSNRVIALVESGIEPEPRYDVSGVTPCMANC
jgi:hypothetical protein